MATSQQAPPSSTTTQTAMAKTARPRNTGFPDAFRTHGPNTTLPHPAADLSPNATLSFDEISTERIMKRHRLSFLRKHKHHATHSMIEMPPTDGLLEVDGDTSTRKLASASTGSLRLSKENSVRSSKESMSSPGSEQKGGNIFRWKR